MVIIFEFNNVNIQHHFEENIYVNIKNMERIAHAAAKRYFLAYYGGTKSWITK